MTGHLVRHFFAAGAAFSVLLTYGCGGSAAKTDSTPSPAPTMASSTLSDIDAFGKNPTETTEEALHVDSLGPQFSSDAESRIVKIVASQDLPRRVLDELAMDLATNDFSGTARWVRLTNIVNRNDPSPEGKQAVKRTALLAWILMAMRADFDTNFVDFGGMDLRVSQPFVGRSMNLDNVSFVQASLPGGVWRSANVTASKFDQADTDGALRCVNCSWGSLRYTGAALLTNGRWIIPTGAP